VFHRAGRATAPVKAGMNARATSRQNASQEEEIEAMKAVA
jgi:hypothetical protein